MHKSITATADDISQILAISPKISKRSAHRHRKDRQRTPNKGEITRISQRGMPADRILTYGDLPTQLGGSSFVRKTYKRTSQLHTPIAEVAQQSTIPDVTLNHVNICSPTRSLSDQSIWEDPKCAAGYKIVLPTHILSNATTRWYCKNLVRSSHIN